MLNRSQLQCSKYGHTEGKCKLGNVAREERPLPLGIEPVIFACEQ